MSEALTVVASLFQLAVFGAAATAAFLMPRWLQPRRRRREVAELERMIDESSRDTLKRWKPADPERPS